jgi:hypothetical protein
LWNCNKKRILNCKSRAKTQIDNGNIIVINESPHSHAPDPNAKENALLRKNIKFKASTSSEQPSLIIHEVLTNMSEDMMNDMPSEDAIKSLIKRSRAKKEPEPSTLEELKVPTEFKFIRGKYVLLLY